MLLCKHLGWFIQVWHLSSPILAYQKKKKVHPFLGLDQKSILSSHMSWSLYMIQLDIYKKSTMDLLYYMGLADGTGAG